MLLGLGLLLYAVARPVIQVRAADGSVCPSAWRAAHRQGSHGGERSRAQLAADLTACEVPGRRALRHAVEAGATGLGLLVLVALWPVRTPRPPLADPLGGTR